MFIGVRAAALILQGAGFDRSVSYRCVFNLTQHFMQESVATLAFINSPTRLSCSSPRSQATLDLLQNQQIDLSQAVISVTADGIAIPFEGGNPSKTIFTYSVTGWTSATPLQSYTSAGAILTIAGTGFGSRGWVYEAKFSAGPFQATSGCSVASLYVIKCPIPGAFAVRPLRCY